jgi:universal stress protein E
MKILSATDFLPKSDAAMDRAGFLADALAGDLTLLYAISPDTPDGQTLEQRLRRADSRLTSRVAPPKWRWGSQPEIAVQCGHPARVVLDNAYRHKAGLVVLGPHRADAVADAVNGTITDKVLAAAACPVLIARQEVHGPYGRVLVALDGGPQGGGIVQTVELLGLARDSAVTVIHAHEPPYVGMMNIVGVGIEAAAGYAESSRAQAAAGIRALIEGHSSDPGRYQVVIIEHRPATAILRAVVSLKPDLLVLGTRGHGRLRRALLGSIASEVMGAVYCDVLLVPDRALRDSRAVA